MIPTIVSSISELFTQICQWFISILGAVDGFNFWVTAFLLNLLFKYILRPFFGAAHSDSIKTSYNAYKNRKKENT